MCDGKTIDHELVRLLHVCFSEHKPAEAVLLHDASEGVELAGFEESRGVPEGSSEVVLWGGLDVMLCSAFLAGLCNVCFEPVRSAMLSMLSVVVGLPLQSALWGRSVVCAKVVGRAVVLWRLAFELEDRPQESSEFVASVDAGCVCLWGVYVGLWLLLAILPL